MTLRYSLLLFPHFWRIAKKILLAQIKADYSSGDDLSSDDDLQEEEDSTSEEEEGVEGRKEDEGDNGGKWWTQTSNMTHGFETLACVSQAQTCSASLVYATNLKDI